jgi:hypothetical protein
MNSPSTKSEMTRDIKIEGRGRGNKEGKRGGRRRKKEEEGGGRRREEEPVDKNQNLSSPVA